MPLSYNTKIRILIVLFFISGKFSNAQNFDETLKFADSAFNNFDFYTADELYNRLIFFNIDSLTEYILYLKKAETLKKQYKYNEAVACCDSAISYKKNNSDEAVIKKCEIYILNNSFSQAETVLNSHNFVDNVINRQIKSELLGIIYFQKENFSVSEQHFLNSIPDDNYYKKKQIKNIFSEIENEKFLNKKTARVLSAIIPGSGLVYAGKFYDGLNSFVLLSAIAYSGLDFALKISPFDAAISILPWFLRYYKSGINKAETETFLKNKIKQTDYLLKIFRTIND